MKYRLISFIALGALACSISDIACAHVDVDINVGTPARVAPVVVVAPPPVHVVTRETVVIGWHGDRYWDGHRYWSRHDWLARHPG